MLSGFVTNILVGYGQSSNFSFYRVQSCPFCAPFHIIRCALSSSHKSAGPLHKCTRIVFSEGAYYFCFLKLIANRANRANRASGETAKVEMIPGLNNQT
jgi:hypothetical protein